MKPQTKIALQQKGWAQEEIAKAEVLLERVESYDRHFSKIVFAIAVVVTLFAHILVAVVLIPLLIALNQKIVSIIVVILGGMLGFIYQFLVKDIGHLKRKHHLLAGIIVPLFALATTVLVVLVSNKFITDLKIKNTLHNPWVIGVLFAIAFMVPQIISTLFFWSQKKKLQNRQ